MALRPDDLQMHRACSHMQLPLVGGEAPDFTAEAVYDQEFQTVTLSQYRVGPMASCLLNCSEGQPACQRLFQMCEIPLRNMGEPAPIAWLYVHMFLYLLPPVA